MASSKKESFDLWHVRNYPLEVDTTKVKLADIGQIDRKYSGRSIHRKNQNYQLIIAFDFIGSYELATRFLSSEADRMNREVLPVGYRADVTNRQDGANRKNGRRFC